MEIWKNVKGFNGIYQVSNLGRLKSFKENKNGRILSNINRQGGYLSVVLGYRGLKKYTRIHRLVAETFIPNPDNKPEVNHIDGNKQNNCVSNLEWVTRKENAAHAMKHNPNILKGMNRYNQFIRPKNIRQYSLDGKFIAEFPNAVEASKRTGICGRNILQVANATEYKPGKVRHQAGGYVWRFSEDLGGKVVGY
jgi:hypothetical protein